MRSKLLLIGKVGFSLVGLGYAFLGEYLNGSGIAELFGLSSVWNSRIGIIAAAVGFFLTLLQEKQEHEEKLSERDKRIAELEAQQKTTAKAEHRDNVFRMAKNKLRWLIVEAEGLKGCETDAEYLKYALKWRHECEEELRKMLGGAESCGFRIGTSAYQISLDDPVLPGSQISLLVKNHVEYLERLSKEITPERIDPHWIPFSEGPHRTLLEEVAFQLEAE